MGWVYYLQGQIIYFDQFIFFGNKFISLLFNFNGANKIDGSHQNEIMA